MNRLARLEGQARGIRRMVSEDQDCRQILAQLNALHEAVRGVSKLVLAGYLVKCAEREMQEGHDMHRALERLADLLLHTKL